MPRSIGLLLIVLVSASSAAGQQRRILLDTNDAGALVYADSTWLGFAGESPFAVPAGAAQLRVVPRNVDAWYRPPIEVAIADTTTIVSALFPYRYRIESMPRASVQEVGTGKVLGETPLNVVLIRPARAGFLVSRQGFRTATAVPDSALWQRLFVELEPLSDTPSSPDVSIDARPADRRWIEWAAGGLAAAGAVTAVHYKLRADARYARYQETGDPALRPEIKRLDTISGVGLGAMQVGVGVIAVRFVLR